MKSERTGIHDIYLEQFKVFGKANQNSKEFIDKLITLNYHDEAIEKTNSAEYEWFTKRFISVGYYALVNIPDVKPQLTEMDESLQWYGIHEIYETILEKTFIRTNFQKKILELNVLERLEKNILVLKTKLLFCINLRVHR